MLVRGSSLGLARSEEESLQRGGGAQHKTDSWESEEGDMCRPVLLSAPVLPNNPLSMQVIYVRLAGPASAPASCLSLSGVVQQRESCMTVLMQDWRRI